MGKIEQMTTATPSKRFKNGLFENEQPTNRGKWGQNRPSDRQKLLTHAHTHIYTRKSVFTTFAKCSYPSALYTIHNITKHYIIYLGAFNVQLYIILCIYIVINSFYNIYRAFIQIFSILCKKLVFYT